MWHDLRTHLELVWGAFLAFGIVIVLAPAVGGVARYLRLVDRPHEGERARPAIPRLGGIALFLGIFVPSVAFLPLGGEMRGILLGAAVATTVGAIDDFRGLAWWQKLAGQVAAASIPTLYGTWVHRFTFPVLGVHELPSVVGVPLTVLGIVAVMNMVNFLDGLDGLAAGVCAISAGSFCLINISLDRWAAAILTAIVFGACVGFLRHNFYPARIFMGDSGALLLGFTLAAVSVQGLLKTAALATLVLPLLVLAVPVLDTPFVIAKRLRSGEPIYTSVARSSISTPGAGRWRWPRSRRDSPRRTRAGGGTGRISPSTPRSACSRSPPRRTSSTCSRSSSSRTRSSAAARNGRGRRRASRPSAGERGRVCAHRRRRRGRRRRGSRCGHAMRSVPPAPRSLRGRRARRRPDALTTTRGRGARRASRGGRGPAWGGRRTAGGAARSRR